MDLEFAGDPPPPDAASSAGDSKLAPHRRATIAAGPADLTEAVPDAKVVLDRFARIVLLNIQAEKQFGYSRDELIGRSVVSIIPRGFAEGLIVVDLNTATTPPAQRLRTGGEFIARRKDGSEFPIEIMLTVLATPHEVLITAATRDITVRKAAEAELVHSRRLEALGLLAGAVAHDVNNDLAVILNYTDLASDVLTRRRETPLTPDAIALIIEDLGHITEAAHRVAALVLQLAADGVPGGPAPLALDRNGFVAETPALAGEYVHLATD